MQIHEITEGILDRAKNWAHNTASNWSDTYSGYHALKSTQAQRAALPKPGTTPQQPGGPSDVLPDPDHVLLVTTANKGRYFKDRTGQWFNELFQPLPYQQFAPLELLIQQDNYQQIEDPRTPLGARQTTSATGANTTKRGGQTAPRFRR
jgi:hypothetical protein